MKKLMIISFLLIAFLPDIFSQVLVDLKLGLSPASSPNSFPILVNRHDPFEEFSLSVVHNDAQFYGGIVMHLPLSTPFFLEGGISYTKRKTYFQANYTASLETREDIQLISETKGMIMLPLNIGVGIGSFDVTSGLTAVHGLPGTNDFSNLKGFHQEGSQLRMGWQAGVRYGFKGIMAGVEFQGTLTRVCEGMFVNDQSLDIRNVPGNVVFSLQYRI